MDALANGRECRATASGSTRRVPLSASAANKTTAANAAHSTGIPYQLRAVRGAMLAMMGNQPDATPCQWDNDSIDTHTVAIIVGA